MHDGDFSLHMYDLDMLYTFFKIMFTMKTAIGVVISIRATSCVRNPEDKT